MSKDKTLFCEFVLKYSDDFLRFCISYTKNRFDADDMLSEAYKRMWTVWDTRQDLPMQVNKAWMLKTISNISKEYYRQKKKTPDDIDGQAEIRSQTNEIEQFEEKRQFEAYVKEIMNELSENEKRVFKLYMIEGYSYKEVSEMIDAPSVTVRSQVSRIRKKLRPKIDKLIKTIKLL